MGLKRLVPRDVVAGACEGCKSPGVDRPLGVSVAAVIEGPDVVSSPLSWTLASLELFSFVCDRGSDEGSRPSEGLDVVLCEEAPRPLPPLPAPRDLGGIFYTIEIYIE